MPARKYNTPEEVYAAKLAAYRRYCESHPEYRKKQQQHAARWKQAHPEQYKAIRKAYYEAHRDEILDKTKAWYRAHREQRTEYQRAYRAAHSEQVNAYMREYNRKRREKEKLAVLGRIKAMAGAGEN